jgi:hypothetical protein
LNKEGEVSNLVALPLLPLIIIGFGVLTVVGIIAAILTGNTGE